MEKAVSGHGVFIYDAAAMVATAVKECDRQPAAKADLALAVAEKGEKPLLVHAYRMLAHQLCGITLAATPGSSPHGRRRSLRRHGNRPTNTAQSGSGILNHIAQR